MAAGRAKEKSEMAMNKPLITSSAFSSLPNSLFRRIDYVGYISSALSPFSSRFCHFQPLDTASRTGNRIALVSKVIKLKASRTKT